MLTEKRFDLGISILIVGLVIAISYILASTIWTLIYGFEVELDKLPGATGTEQVAAVPAINISRLVGWQLFGQYQARANKKQPKTATVAPKTKLRLELQGVFHGDNEADSTAIIAEKGKNGELYHIGDTIKGGVKLNAVYADRVILSRNGKLEGLYFDESFKPQTSGYKIDSTRNKDAKKASGKLSRSSQSSAPVTQSGQPLANAKSKLGGMIASGKRYSNKSIVKAITEDLKEDPESALSDLGLEGSESGGFTIAKGASRDLLRTMGLRSGDKILSINGQPLGGSAADAAVIQSAIGGSKVRVEIQRGSRRFTVNVDVPKF